MDHVISWTGEIDYAQQQLLSIRTTEALMMDGLTRLVIDLSQVTFIDSSGIGTLVQTRNDAMRRDIKVAIRDASRPVTRLFHIAGLTGLFDAV